MDDFAGWPGWGWLSPGGIPCLNPVFRLGPFGSACGPYRCRPNFLAKFFGKKFWK
jgi:hypothetical protein